MKHPARGRRHAPGAQVAVDQPGGDDRQHPADVQPLRQDVGAEGSAHPFENPTAWTNFLSAVAILLLPYAAVIMFGRMLNNMRHAAVLYGVMLALLAAQTGWSVSWDTFQPNPGLARRAGHTYHVTLPGGKRTVTIR